MQAGVALAVVAVVATLVALFTPRAWADEPAKPARTEATPAREAPQLSLEPDAPQVGTLPGGVTPAFETVPTPPQDWAIAVHGFLSVPLRIGFNERENPGPDQSKIVLHAPARVPGDLESFGYLGLAPDPWVQLNFSFNYKYVTATVIVAARTASNASGYFNPPDMLGINDAFLTFRLPIGDKLKLTLNAGAFANTYGNLGEYDLGRFGTPLIARVGGTGATATGALRLGDFDLIAEAGFQGQFKKVPVGVEPAGWNGFADANVGTSWVAHVHAAVGYQKWVQIAGHYLKAFSNDDRATPQTQPDGSIDVGGVELRLSLARFGHLHFAYAYTDAKTSRSVSDVIRVLNAPGGKGLMDEYFDPNGDGTGQLHTFGGQYDFSLGNLLRYPGRFEGDGPDLIASVFAIFTRAIRPTDRLDKAKYGFELGYSPLSWLALSGRFDRVQSVVGDSSQIFTVLTGRLIFHTGWNSQDQVVLQYSHWFDGPGTVVKDGYPPVYNPTIVPDADVLSLMANMWW